MDDFNDNEKVSRLSGKLPTEDSIPAAFSPAI
jgi:hypothetical protein